MIEQLKKLIEALTITEFRVLIKEYLKVYYSTNDVNIVDGKGDGGIDLTVTKDGKQIKKSFQITVQASNIETKITNDINNALSISKEYGFDKELRFYYSKTISYEKQLEYKRLSETKYDIALEIYDSYFLANFAQNNSRICKLIYALHGIKYEETKIDKNTKILFDVLTEGKDAVDIKHNFIYSYLLTFIFQNPDSTIDMIFDGLKDIFACKYKRDHFMSWLSKLETSDFVIYDRELKKYNLTQTSNDKLNKIINHTSLVESEIKKKLLDFLTQYELQDKLSNLFELLIKIHQENYEIDIEEIGAKHSSFSTSMKRVYSDITNFFIQNHQKDKSDKLTNNVLKICEETDYFDKIAISALYTNLFKSDKLEDYVNKKIEFLYLDTQILLWLVCILYRNIDSTNYTYNIIKSFYETIENNKGNIKLHTTIDYINELAAHFLDAIKLYRFVNSEIINKLGPSRNIFYNYFLLLSKTDSFKFKKDYLGYLEDILGINIPKPGDAKILEIISTQFVKLFELLNLKIVTPGIYQDFNEGRKLYEIDMSYNHINKPPASINHDVRIVFYLTEEKNHIDEKIGLSHTPYLITWDTFFGIYRESFLKKFTGIGNFYTYTPSKYIDIIKTKNFEINPKSLSYNIILLTEEQFNSSKTTYLDVLSSLFNEEKIEEWGLLKKLNNLKEQTKKQSSQMGIGEIVEENTPLTDVLQKLRITYVNKKEYSEFIKLFNIKELEDKIISILKESIITFDKTHKLSENTISDFDNLITKLKY